MSRIPANNPMATSTATNAPPGSPGFVPPAGRMEMLRTRRRDRAVMRQLYRGEWYRVLITMANTAHRFREVRSHSGKLQPLFTKVNLIRRAVELHADIMAAQPPTVSVPEGFDAQAQAVAEIQRRSLFEARFHEAAVKVSVEAEAALVARIDETSGQSVVQIGSNEEWVPVGPPGPDGQPTVWERRWVVERGAGATRRTFLRVERHRVGRAVAGGGAGGGREGAHVIEQEAYEGKGLHAFADLASAKRVPLATAIGPERETPEERTVTGLSTNPIVQLVRYRDEDEPCPLMTRTDIELVDAMAAAWSRLDRANELHANARMRVSESMIGADGRVKSDDTEAVHDPEGIVGYIVAEYKFEEMVKLVDRLSEWMLAGVLAVSPSLIGMKLSGGAAPDSFDKLQLEAMNTLTANKRAAPYMNSALGRLLTSASEIQSRRVPLAGFAVAPVSVKVHPQLPRNEQQRMRDIAEQEDRGLLDELSALEEAHGDERAALIYERKQAERAAESARQREALFGAVPVGGSEDPAIDEPMADPVTEPGSATPREQFTGIQIERLLDIAERVRNSVIELETAVNIVSLAFDLDEAEARRLLQAEVGKRTTFEIEAEAESAAGGDGGGDA